MDRRFKLSLLGAAFFAAAQFNGAAMNGAAAADLLPPPAIVEAPEVVQKSNTGWYLRGDISYDFQSSDGFYNETNQAHYSGALDDAFNIGLGLGYQITNNFRVDLTGEYVFDGHTGFMTTGFCGIDPLGNGHGVCSSEDGSDVSKFKLMGNAYVDLGHFGHFTPYVGAGIGGAYVSYDNLSTTQTCTTVAPYTCPAPHPAGVTTSTVNANDQFSGDSNWRFAWALHAGTAYSLSEKLKLDVGYTYSKIEGGKAFSYNNNSATDTTASIYDKGFEDHTIRAGLRYQFGH